MCFTKINNTTVYKFSISVTQQTIESINCVGSLIDLATDISPTVNLEFSKRSERKKLYAMEFSSVPVYNMVL